ncbi:MAG: MFS transporter [Tabrizicola sp.]|uniref:MFS transporter n=1 Tax=Tabrizicola sp. TaxID=2005166 RepID=UPI0027326D2B|nr:MFS transporter [Tabrizicola sp.]MDP3261497.1 MFS transporter [Tabrizicola sp.]MDP3649286.1 MFS transporter [Paracoccaceae bacterium]MDZ4067596.1 MFS transporter [Tabrizicola sp.]
MPSPMPLSETHRLPAWRRPEALLYLMAAAMPLSFATWSALLNNFVIEVASFTGREIGWLHTVREIPGLLAVVVIVILLAVREQVLALGMLALLGAATMFTGWFTSFSGLLVMTLLSSIGFHYFETVNQSLQLQWTSKARAPIVLGRIVAVGAGASLAAYGAIVALWDSLGLDYNTVYMASGGLTIAIVLFAALAYPQFESPHVQHKHMVLRRRYWLYYALQFMSGARRQIFVVFAGFMMVERFGMKVSEMTLLLLCNYLINMAVAPMMGRALGRYGERNVMGFEYIGLTLVFLAYGGLYWFGWGIVIAGGLYILDQLFFALSFSLKTYFQKIADPKDIAPTAAVAFTINHIAAVFLPASLGYLWATSPDYVFLLGAGMALVAFALVCLIPRHPEPGLETVFSRGVPLPAE